MFESSHVSHKSFGHSHISLWPLVVQPNIQSNNFTKFISQKNIRCIKSMRSISIEFRSIRDMVRCFVVLLLLVGVVFDELDKFFVIVVHS
jgi:hypothetical protein